MGIYGHWIDRWERKLATRDNNRVVRPFEWGLDWLQDTGIAAPDPTANGDSAGRLMEYVERAVADSDRFYSYRAVTDYRLDGERLSFTSPVATSCPVNNTVQASWFPAAEDQGRALVVLPQWNADAGGHIGLCKLLNRFGVSALRMTMAYHAERMPPELERADYHMSSNIGRTVHAFRQSAIDTRACLDWLAARGYERVGVLGTSLGSCVAFMAVAHDQRPKVAIFNHVSLHVADVVWTGISTQHVRKGFGDRVAQADLRRYWAPISPASYLDRMQNRDLRSLLIWARHDSSFLPRYSKPVVEAFRRLRLPHQEFRLPCGHYTTGSFPFNIMDGLAMCRFAARWL
jgi:hypothetical protein